MPTAEIEIVLREVRFAYESSFPGNALERNG